MLTVHVPSASPCAHVRRVLASISARLKIPMRIVHVFASMQRGADRIVAIQYESFDSSHQRNGRY